MSLKRKSFRGTKKAFVRLEEAPAHTLLKANHIKIGWVSCRIRRKTEINRCYRCLALAIWRQTAGGPIEACVAGGAASRDVLRGPGQENRGAISAPHERRNPGMIILRGQCVAWRSERQLQIGGLREATNRVEAGNRAGSLPGVFP